MLALFAELFSRFENATTQQNRIFVEHEIIRLNSFMDSKAGAQLSPADLAQHLDLSSDYFSRKFRAHFKLSPREWIKSEKIRRASVLLLESRLSIKEIAHRLGWGDQRFFARQFKHVTGSTPSHFRRLY